jgi:hypothetical protein
MLPVQKKLKDHMLSRGIDVYGNPDHWDMYKLLSDMGLMRSSTVIRDVAGLFAVGGVWLRLERKGTHRRKHRVFIGCDCGTFVPYGRLHQHKCK